MGVGKVRRADRRDAKARRRERAQRARFGDADHETVAAGRAMQWDDAMRLQRAAHRSEPVRCRPERAVLEFCIGVVDESREQPDIDDSARARGNRSEPSIGGDDGRRLVTRARETVGGQSF